MEFKGLFATLYDRSLKTIFLGKENLIRKEVANLIPDKKLRVLEIGCGTGSQIIEIKKQREKAECYGVDVSKDMLNIAENKSKKSGLDISFSLQNMNKLNFRDNYFDIVVAPLSLHEVDSSTRNKGMENISRVLKKKGKLILFDFIKARGFFRIIQKAVFFISEEHAENFLNEKEGLLKNFKKISSKKVLKILSIEEYSKN